MHIRFSESQLIKKSRNATLRSINCHQCDRCHLSLQGNAFEGNATTCKSCLEAEKEWPCAACRKEQAAIFFDANIFRNFEKMGGH